MLAVFTLRTHLPRDETVHHAPYKDPTVMITVTNSFSFVERIIHTLYRDMDIILENHIIRRNSDLLDKELSRKRRHSEADFSDDDASSPKSSNSPSVDEDRRAHHNELERRRRDHIKDHFMALKEAIPLLEGEKSSRALILKRAVEYIGLIKSRLSENNSSVEELKRRNEFLEEKLKERGVDVPSPLSPPTTHLPSIALPTAIPQLPTTSAALPQMLPQLTLPSVSLPPVTASSPITSLDALRLNSLLTPSGQENLLALTALIQSAKFNQPKPAELPSLAVPDFQSRLIANTLAIRDRQLAAVRF